MKNKETDEEYEKKLLDRVVKLPLFSTFAEPTEFNSKVMKLVISCFSVKKFKKGDKIIQEGEIGDEFYILHSGSVKIFKNTLSGDIIALANLSAEQNVFFGENALISTNTRSATIQAATDCTVIVMNREDFMKIAEIEPLIGYRVTMCLAQRLADTISKSNNDVTTLYEALFNEIEGDL